MPEFFKLRRAGTGDASEITKLIKNTVRLVNARDYSFEEIEAWAPEDFPIERMQERIANSSVHVSEDGTGLTGVASFKPSNLIDLLYVRHDRLRRGIGSRLLSAVEEEARKSGAVSLVSNVSITAKPFFSAAGYSSEAEQKVVVNGQNLTNFRMIKRISG